MAQKSKPRTSRKSSYRGFEGVDLKKTHSGDESIAFIDNFRITDDGTLEKRCGFKKIYSSKSPEYNEIGSSYCYAPYDVEASYFTQGRYVKKYDSALQSVVDIGTLSDDTVSSFFFEYLGSLFVCDGHKIFKINQNEVSTPSLYIPLYGKDWPSSFAGEKYETPNLLTTKLAISYKLTAPATSWLPLGDIALDSIDAVFRNGELLNEDQYEYHEKYNAITIFDFADDDTFFAIVNFKPDAEYAAQQAELFSSHHTSLFYELNKNNIFFWGNKTTNKVFYSTSINEEYASITDQYIDQERFYVPVGSFFRVAAESDRIKSFIRHYDRVLIMTDSSTWITNLQDIESGSLKIKNINSEIGCVSYDGCVRIENTLFSIGKDAIYAWSADTDELNECNAYSISEPIRQLLNNNFLNENCSVHAHRPRNELWFYNSNKKLVWIYNYNRKAWYSISGFSPKLFLDSRVPLAFFEGSTLYCFDDSLTADIHTDKRVEIVAKLKSGELEFNTERQKKLATTTIRGIASGGTITLRALLDGKTEINYTVTPKSVHSVTPFRTRSGSFGSMSFELIASGEGTQAIHGIELIAD